MIKVLIIFQVCLIFGGNARYEGLALDLKKHEKIEEVALGLNKTSINLPTEENTLNKRNVKEEDASIEKKTIPDDKKRFETGNDDFKLYMTDLQTEKSILADKAGSKKFNQIFTDKALLNEASKRSLQILCLKALNDDLKGFDIFGHCIIEKGGFDYCLNSVGREKLCDADVETWGIKQVPYNQNANCATWITLTKNGCKVVLAAGHYSPSEEVFYAKSSFNSLFWKGKKAETITYQLKHTTKEFILKRKYLNIIYFEHDL